MTIPHLLLALFIYLSVISIIVGYAVCVIAGRSDAGLTEEPMPAEPQAVVYRRYSVDDHLALG